MGTKGENPFCLAEGPDVTQRTVAQSKSNTVHLAPNRSTPGQKPPICLITGEIHSKPCV